MLGPFLPKLNIKEWVNQNFQKFYIGSFFRGRFDENPGETFLDRPMNGFGA